MSKKPRSTLCWLCGKKLYQSKIHVEVMIDNHPRILHKACAKELEEIKKGFRDE